jgi:hypothetical protein
LGEFPLIGRLFIVGSFWKITEVAHIFGLLFATVKVMNEKWVGGTFWLNLKKLIWSPWF